MIKKIYILAILLVLTAATYAQNFTPGYVIMPDKSKLSGFIDFSTNKNNSQQCRFKAADDAEIQLFLPTDIASYMFINEGKYYVSREIEIDGTKKTVFLEFLVEGMMNLYFYKDPKNSAREYYFFEDKEGNITQISKKPNKFNGKIDIVDNKYVSQLNYLFREFPEMSEIIMKTSNESFRSNSAEKLKEFRYDRSNMIELVKTYHGKACTTGEECIVFENDASRRYIKLQLSAYAGVQWTNFKWDLPNLKTINVVYPTIGAQFSISDPRVSQSFSLLIDGSLSNFKGENEFGDPTGSYTKIKLSALTTSWKLGIQYSYPKGKVRPSIGVGYGIHMLINKSNKTYMEERNGRDIMVKNFKNLHDIPGSYHGLNLNVGCDYMVSKNRAIFFQASYDDTKGKLAGEYKGNINVKFMQFKAGYRF